MIRQLLTGLLFLSVTGLRAQTVIHDVHFDNYTSSTVNDFTASFSGNTGLYQIPGNGITGGCLATPDSNNWGNDNAFYCATYQGQQGTIYRTSVAFKYDATIVQPGFDRTCSIWLIPSADFNHYLISSVTHDKRIQVISYSFVNPSAPVMNLQQNHWYSLQTEYTFTSAPPQGNININCSVYDLGLTGLTTPLLVNSVSGSFNDTILTNDPAINVGITGTRYGGALYLDDFHFEGEQGTSTCLPSGIETTENNPAQVFCQDGILYIKDSTQSTASITDLSGRTVRRFTASEGNSTYDISDLYEGIYILQMEGDGNAASYKFFVNH